MAQANMQWAGLISCTGDAYGGPAACACGSPLQSPEPHCCASPPLLCVLLLLAPQKCPFDAIMIINLPKNLEGHTTHRYGPNSFKLHR
jgi:hypothetical protein